MSEELQPLQRRIQRLEILLAVCVLFALAPWAAILFGAWKLSSNEIELAHTLVVPALELRTPGGNAVVKLAAAGHSGSVQLLDEQGRALLSLGSGPGESGALRMNNAAGKELVYLGSEPQGGGNLTLHAKTGNVVACVRDNDGHGGGIQLLRENKLIGYVGAGVNDVGLVQLLDKNAKEYALLTTNKDGDAILSMSRANGNKAAHLGVDDTGATSLQLFSSDQKGAAWITSGDKGGKLGMVDSRGLLRAWLGQNGEGYEVFELLGDDGKDICQMGDNGVGGVLNISAYGGLTALSASADDRYSGAGNLSLFHPGGGTILALGSSYDETSGIIDVWNLQGEMIYREPGGLLKD